MEILFWLIAIPLLFVVAKYLLMLIFLPIYLLILRHVERDMAGGKRNVNR